MSAWFKEAVFYHIYPFGELKDRQSVMSLRDIAETLVPHIHKMGFTAVYLGPVWKSTWHGYDTIDYLTVDPRIGSNDDLYRLVETCHENGLKVVLDAVFNHVGPDFPAYRDVMEKKEGSRYIHWFRHAWRNRRGFFDSVFSFFGLPNRPEFEVGRWPGSMDLFELNLENAEVKCFLLDAVGKWIDWFHIDGLRLDVADGLPIGFLQELRAVTSAKKADFYLVGELTAPRVDYRERCGPGRCDGALNYWAKGALLEALLHQDLRGFMSCLDAEFGCNGRYQELALYNFLENHDTDRIASCVSKFDLHLAYALLFMSPGAPSVFYGGEWGAVGRIGYGDLSARRAYAGSDLARGTIPNATESNLARDIERLIACRMENHDLGGVQFERLEVVADGLRCAGKDIVAFRRSETLLCLASRLDNSRVCVVRGCADGVYEDVLNKGEEPVRAEDGELRAEAFPGWVRLFRKVRDQKETENA